MRKITCFTSPPKQGWSKKMPLMKFFLLLTLATFTLQLSAKSSLNVDFKKTNSKTFKKENKRKAEIIVKGKVTDESGAPLPNVNVKVQGGATAITNEKGEYAVKAEENGTLTFTSIGFATQTAKINGRNTVNIKMAESAKMLDEVVAVGYGTTRKKDLTGAVAMISKKDLKNVPITRVDQMIQGKAAGVQVSSISGAPGSGSSIRIRGTSSFTANSEPLYVIDGLIGGGDINTLNPEDIETISLLKDASSTAIYGSRGANGVVLITTKKGTPGQSNINLDVYSGWQKLPKFIPMMNATQYAQLANESAIDYGKAAPFANPESFGEGTNWQKEITRTAPTRNYTIGISGGEDKYNYYLSGNYSNQDGIIMNSGFERYQFRANLNKKVKDNLNIGAVFNVGRAQTQNNPVELGGLGYYQSALAYPSTGKVYNADGTFDSTRPNDPQVYDNPVAQGMLVFNQYTSTNLTGNIFAEWEFIKGLTLKSTFGSELGFGKSNVYYPGALPTRKNSGQGGYASVGTSNSVMWLSENTLTYNKTINTDHNISALMGFTFQNNNLETLNAGGSKYATDVFAYNNLAATDQLTYGIGSGYSKASLVSYLARLNYAYKNKYLLTINARIDGASRLSAGNKYATFPGAAIAWNASNEEFIKKLNVFDNLKFRASYGQIGNQAIDPYKSLSSLRSVTRYLIGGNTFLGYIGDNVPNPNLTWEISQQLDLGVEFGILKGRLNVEIDYYNKKTKDLLLDQQLPTQTGFYSKVSNVGSLSNKGLELTINSKNIVKDDFTWETTFNISTNKSKVLDLGGVKGFDLASTGYGGTSTLGRLSLGEPVSTFWGATYVGTLKTTAVPAGQVVTSSTPRLGDPVYLDYDGDGKFSIGDYHSLGSGDPKFFGGLGNTFTYKKISLNVFLQGSAGNKVMNVSSAFYATGEPLNNQYAEIVNRWSPTNPNSDIPRVNSRDYVTSSRWVYDGSFLRLKTLSLSYALTGKDLKAPWIKRINVFATGTNLFLITKYPYYDPESNAYGTSSALRGFDYTNYPQNRTFVLGANITL